MTNLLGGVPIAVTDESAAATRFHYAGRIKEGDVTLRDDSQITLP